MSRNCGSKLAYPVCCVFMLLAESQSASCRIYCHLVTLQSALFVFAVAMNSPAVAVPSTPPLVESAPGVLQPVTQTDMYVFLKSVVGTPTEDFLLRAGLLRLVAIVIICALPLFCTQ